MVKIRKMSNKDGLNISSIIMVQKGGRGSKMSKYTVYHFTSLHKGASINHMDMEGGVG